MKKRVFVNRTLNMRGIRAIGFDMDHTLVRYNIHRFEEETHKCILKRLIAHKKYPKEIINFKFEFERVIRGLVIDTKKGNILKLSRYRSVRDIYHGKQKIQYTNRRAVYPNDYIHFGIHHPDFSFIESHFSLAFALAYIQLVELKKNQQLPDFQQIFIDVKEAVDHIHTYNDVKNHVMKHPEEYLIRTPSLASHLETLLKHGKKLFLLTNSSFDYCSFLMDYTISPFLKENTSWMDIFDIVITDAQKPQFFHQEKEFQPIDKTGQDIISHGVIPKKGLYRNGSASRLTHSLKLREDEILYIGDQVYTDVVLLKQKCGWRTALVIEELDTENQILQKNQPVYKEIQNLMEDKKPMEEEIGRLTSDQVENHHKNHSKKISTLQKEVEKIDEQLALRIEKINKNFNPYWGELMRVGVEESLFASQAERFSCIYMPYIEDFLSQSPRTYYRAGKRLFPHEI